MPKIHDSVRAIIAARMDAPSDGSTRRIGFEDWLSYVANASFIGATPTSPIAGVQWRANASPTQGELVWFVDKIGKAIFAECALALSDTEPSAAAAAAAHIA